MTFQNNKIEIFAGINDLPTPPTSTTAGNGSHLIAQINTICDDLDTAFSNISGIDTTVLTNQVNQLVNIDIPDIQTNLNDVFTTLSNIPSIPNNFTFSDYDSLGSINYMGSELELYIGDPKVKITSNYIGINGILFEKDDTDPYNRINVIYSDLDLKIKTWYGGSIYFSIDKLELQAPPNNNKILLNSDVQFTSKVFDPNGNQLLGIQESAIPDAVAGTEINRINAILSALRSHGLIAN